LELKQALLELDKAETSFKVALANQRIHQINEETTYGKAKEALIGEIKALERRRAELLIPIDAERNEAHTMYIQAEELRQTNRAKEIAIDEMVEVLGEKLDDASEKNEMLSGRKVELDRREAGIAQQEEMTKTVITKLTEDITAKANECATRELLVAEKEKESQFKEISIQSQFEQIEREYKFIKDEKVRLKDREDTLERNLKRNV